MRQTALVAWAALCIVSLFADLGAVAGHPADFWSWLCLALDAGTVPLAAWLYGRPPLRIWPRQQVGRR